MFENHLVRRVVTGRGSSAKLPQFLRDLGVSSCFLVSDVGVESANRCGPPESWQGNTCVSPPNLKSRSPTRSPAGSRIRGRKLSSHWEAEA